MGETGDWWHCGSQTIHATHHQDEEQNNNDQSDDGGHDKGVEDDDNDTDDTLAAKLFTLPTIKMMTVMMVIKITMM